MALIIIAMLMKAITEAIATFFFSNLGITYLLS
jgi:hypothetical protein